MDNLAEPIAIVGMAGRFPGAADTARLWSNLVEGREAVRFPSEDELRSSGVSGAALADPAYVRAVAEPEGLDLFDAGFFGLTRREAEVCDPQLRLYLETCHAAVENAGYDASALGRAGVFSSVAANRYGIGRVLSDPEALRSATGMAVGMWNNPDSASTLVSYKLNLHGPSMTVQTACSSSLVAVHLAVNALRLNECDVALAGGADVEFPVGHGYRWAQDGPLSRDGHCRPFDASATGTIFASGAGVVVLKRLADAVADGDRVVAVIRSVAVNNDGAHKVGFAAPSADRQAEVVLRAMEVAGVRPADIGYVEAHATATRLGDAIEIAALRKAFGALEPGRCPIGSVKGNVGHLGHAAGVTSLIKAALSLQHGQIPASINLDEVNPFLDLGASPFSVNAALRPWPRSRERRLAGVSSFGIGGTNAHAILEEAPDRVAAPVAASPQLIVWSARTPAAAEAYPGRLGRSFEEGAEPLENVAYTLQQGRTPYPVRGAVVAESLADAARAVRDDDRRIVTPQEPVDRRVVFLLPGQEACHDGMAAELRRTEPVFGAAFDEAISLFDAPGAAEELFSVDYALGRLWLALGVEPDVLVGDGVGELAAAALAGVHTLAEAARLVGGATGIEARRPRRPVHPAAELDAVLADGELILLEAGPGRTLTTRARRHRRHLLVPTLPSGPARAATERASFLNAVARMWTLGARIDWSCLGTAGARERVPLPGYPYQRERHWIDRVSAPGAPNVSGASGVSGVPEAGELDGSGGRPVFRLPTWVETAPAAHHVTAVRPPTLVILPGDPGRADELAGLFVRAGWDATLVRPDADLARVLDEPEHYPELVVDASQLGDLPEPDLDGIDGQLDTGFHRVVTLLREMALRAPDRRARDVVVVTEGSADVTGAEAVHPVRAMLLGLLRSHMLENPRSTCKLVDVQGGVLDDRLLAELGALERSEIVALRGDRRWVPGERELLPDGVGPAELRRGGAYVITGGLGGLGLAVARGLAGTGLRPRLLLLGRTAGEREPGELAEVRALGAECHVEGCDVTDASALRRVLDSFGHVDGVFHLAGVAGDGMIPFRTREQMAATLAPKVHGTLALIEVLRGRPDLAFFVAFSSRAALRGLVGGADYAAANAFLDAVMRRGPLEGCASVTVNWPSWAEVGMAARQVRDPGVRRWSVPLSADDYPILDEHRMDGIPVLPGTAQVDFVLRAFRETVAQADGRAAQMRHMVFRRPITAPEPVTLEVGFEPHDGLWRFTVRTTHAGGSHVHTTGEIRPADTPAPTVDLDKLRASLPDRRVPVNDAQNRMFTIGPHWPGEELWSSGDDHTTRLAVLTFPEAFRHELDEHALHPTLLDAAVSLARDPDHEPPHAPFAYQSIVAHRPIPALAYSHIRRRPSGPGTIVADIDVVTPRGEVAVEVRGFTMRRVDESMVANRDAPAAGIVPAEGAAPVEGRVPADGILPADGVEMLMRLLAAPSHRQVAVTMAGQDAVLKAVPARAVREQPEAPAATPAATPAVTPATEQATVQAPEQTSVEERLAAMWCAEFGLDSIGDDEDFFELGGDSFTAVGLVEEIRREFGVDVGIAVIFDHPTVAALGLELKRLTG
ncbi:SDR family NAD(P)-dependent oxidoreductase [Nonomuraea soli]|uniref:Acyl transferase domain-containing protein n=1 Tax=Nonomuraea soli TaxID=1032476 RepID=A0A7W0HWH0_9ACTN|nr:SDR family NAD(P)-dependent oxidoreductase [Nonomuraea soli]MBA2897821.1 acyl transferase domain-containing protein [Nonomuraea soli]